MDKQAFIAAVKAAGIVGEGGAGFPAHVKYAADADTVIANGCECEPLLHTDQHHMLHHANEIVRAFSELMQATGANVSGQIASVVAGGVILQYCAVHMIGG